VADHFQRERGNLPKGVLLVPDTSPEPAMHPVYILAFVTFLLVIAFLAWNLISVRKHQKTGGKTSGFGGPNDPMA
jgi:hypothetical protein